jgi:hypothetical protein
MRRLLFVWLIGVLTALFLSACAQNNIELVEPVPAVAEATPPSEPIVRVVTAIPSPTPAVCTPLSPHMSVRLIPFSEVAFTLEVVGMQAEEAPILIVSGSTATGGTTITRQFLGRAVADGRFSEVVSVRGYDDIPHWQGKFIHAQGVTCFEFSLPPEEVELTYTP